MLARGGRVVHIAGRDIQEGKCLADGGFAFVHEARDARTGEAFALRRALCHDEEGIAKARAEIALLRRLPEHPSIVRFYGAELVSSTAGRGSDALSLFELCPGGTMVARLESAIASAKPSKVDKLGPACCCPCLPEDEVLNWLQSMVGALAHLHAQLPVIIHYDVKSENIIRSAATPDCPRGCWKLCDFGSASERTFVLAEAPRRELLEVEEFIHGRCTPIYRPPEVADVYLRWPIGPKVDLFALGCVLFAVLTATHPFPMDGALANIQARFQLPDEATAAYSSAVLRWVRRLLARSPDNRPSAAIVQGEVLRFQELGEEPPDAASLQDVCSGTGGSASRRGSSGVRSRERGRSEQAPTRACRQAPGNTGNEDAFDPNKLCWSDIVARSLPVNQSVQCGDTSVTSLTEAPVTMDEPWVAFADEKPDVSTGILADCLLPEVGGQALALDKTCASQTSDPFPLACAADGRLPPTPCGPHVQIQAHCAATCDAPTQAIAPAQSTFARPLDSLDLRSRTVDANSAEALEAAAGAGAAARYREEPPRAAAPSRPAAAAAGGVGDTACSTAPVPGGGGRGCGGFASPAPAAQPRAWRVQRADPVRSRFCFCGGGMRTSE